MASTAQIDANRRNAQKSTGPKTDKGKAGASQNALRHGLASKQLVVYGETQEDFERLFADLRTAYAPADAAEEGLVEHIAMAQWRLRRAWRAEAAALNEETLRIARRRARRAATAALAAELKAHPPEGRDLLPEDIKRLAAAGVYALSDDEIEETMTPEDDGNAPAEPRRADTLVWPEAMTHIARYEGTLERALARATRDLERRQTGRRHWTAAAEATVAEPAPERHRAAASATPARRPADGSGNRARSRPGSRARFTKRSQFRLPKRGNGAMKRP
jgi:hypothetical protein